MQIIGSDVSVCGMTNEEREVIVPASNTMGVEVTPGKEQVSYVVKKYKSLSC